MKKYYTELVTLRNGKVDSNENTLAKRHAREMRELLQRNTITNHERLGYAIIVGKQFNYGMVSPWIAA